MFGSIFSFEVRRLMRSLSTYIYFLVLFVVTFLLAQIAGGAFREAKFNTGGEKILANAPIIIGAFYSAINNYIGLIILVAVVGNAVLKDFSYNTYSMIFTTPVSRFQYLFGRFSGAMFVSLLILTGPAFGLMLGYVSPWVNPDRIGAFMLLPYVTTYWQTIIPNALICGTIFFSVSLISRDIFVIWLSLIIFFVANGVASAIFGKLELETVAALADPMGNFAKRAISKHWSTFEKNNRIVSMEGLFLYNRLLWLAIASGIWAIGYSFFSFSSSPRRLSFSKPKKIISSGKMDFVPSFFQRESLPSVHPLYTTGAMLRSLWGLAINECKTLLRNVYFQIMLLFMLLLLLLVSGQIGDVYETSTFPVTYQVLVFFFDGTSQIFIVILTILFGGELVWRAREFRMSNILDALPVPNWVFYISKLVGLMFMQILLLGVIMIAGIGVQLYQGYTHLELGLYLQYLFGFRMIDLWMLAVVSIFVQTLVSNKYLGYFIVALFYIWNSVFAFLVLKHNLFVFSSDPGVVYSDMNGFGHVTYPFLIFKLYWGAFCIVLAGLSSIFWARGINKSFRMRLAESGGSSFRKSQLLIVGALVLFLSCGGFIYYNTNVLNKYRSNYEQQKEQVKYEKTYGKYKNSPQPKITDVKLNVDLYPYKRGLHTSGTYGIKNKTNAVIDSVHIIVPTEMTITEMTLSREASLLVNDSAIGYRIYRLRQPLQPGDTATLAFDMTMVTKGFQHNFTGLRTPVYNGTFVNNKSILPAIGYDDGFELSNNADRKTHGLAYRRTANSITDTAAWQHNLFIHDADFISFDATVSTVPDQIAVAPGYLQREWTDKGRKYFHYKMDSPILNFYSFLSARYEVKKDKWKGVNLEIYYNKGHEYNLDRMLHGIKQSLTYYSDVFSPYQHRQVRILEFPRYATFAQSFPNTIPFSESIGFIADVDDDDKDDLDYPFYVTAHEVAHQWFAHQVVGADVEGSNILSESLAQYGSIMVMEREYGVERIRKFLQIEMDKYLTARSGESEKEKPWAYADAGQGYILYQKGGVLMHALNKYLGEDSLNHAVSRFLRQFAFQGAPYPTTLDLIASIRRSAPDSMQYFITDAFQKITLYDNKIVDAKVSKEGKGYLVNLTVDSKKYYADSTGKETLAPGSNYVDIGIYRTKDTLATMVRFKLDSGATKLSIPVADKPYKVVVDPYLMLIDKKLSDNEKRLKAIANDDRHKNKHKESGVKVKVGA